MSLLLRLWRLSWPLRARLKPGAVVGGAFPDFTLRGTDGRERSLYDATPGTFTLLWLTNLCEGCRGRIPLIEELLRAEEGRLRALAVSILPVDDPLPARVAESVSFPILLDPEDIVTRRLGQEHPPGTCPLRNLYILDGKGTILFKHHLSAVKPDELRRAVRARLYL